MFLRFAAALLLSLGVSAPLFAAQWCAGTTYVQSSCYGDAQALCTAANAGTVTWPFGSNISPASCSGNGYLRAYYVSTAPDPCPSGQTWSNTTHSCQPITCPSGQHLVGSSCVPDPDCPTGQTYNATDQECAPDSPRPSDNDQKDFGVDCSGASTGEQCVNQAGYGFACGAATCVNVNGWQYAVTGAVCGTVGCTVSTIFTGNPTDWGDPQNAPANSTSPPASQVPTASCPSGFTLSSGGVCVSSGTAGAPSTSTTPGSAPTPGAMACPVGMALQPNGTCAAVTQSQYGACPAGYALSNGVCVASSSAGQPGTNGNGTSGDGKCGAPGQPACSVSLTAPDSNFAVDIASASSASVGEYSGLFSGLVSTVNNWSAADPSKAQQGDFYSQWVDFIEPVPQTGCVPLSAQIGEHTWAFDPCPTAEKISTIVAYALWFYLAWGVFVMVTGGKQGG